MIRLEGFGWFTSDGETKQGPLAAAAVVQMVQSGSLQASHLIWKEGMPEWVAAGSVPGLFGARSSAPGGPPPLPNTRRPVSTAAVFDALHGNDNFGITATEGSASDPEGFLTSPITKALVGKKYEFYRKRWSKILTKTDGDFTKAATKTAWMTAPLLAPYAWFFYRKMYLYGATIYFTQFLLLALTLVGLPDKIQKGLDFVPYGYSIYACLFGPSLYLHHIRSIWNNIHNADEDTRDELIRIKGGTNIMLSVLSIISIPIIVLFAAYLKGELL